MRSDLMGLAGVDEGLVIATVGYPVVPKGEARLRAQPNAGHTADHLDLAVEAIKRIAKKVGVL